MQLNKLATTSVVVGEMCVPKNRNGAWRRESVGVVMCTKTLCLVLWLVTAGVYVHASKLDVLGATFKKNVNEVKSWPQVLYFHIEIISS